jgi:hypothetical protein
VVYGTSEQLISPAKAFALASEKFKFITKTKALAKCNIDN